MEFWERKRRGFPNFPLLNDKIFTLSDDSSSGSNGKYEIF